MDTNRLQFLIDKYLSEDINPSEREALFDLINHPDYREQLEQMLDRQLQLRSFEMNVPGDTKADILRHFEPVLADAANASNNIISPVHRTHFLRRSWLRYAAAIIVLLGGAAIWYTQFHKIAKQGEKTVAVQSSDITPGANRAVLTVGNNQPINLSNDKTGIAVGTAITYNDGERIADAGQTLQLVTPRGGQYQALLPDGSKVWLNAASSVQFPSKFIDKERKVKITGEVYIEVAPDKTKPFVVDVDGKSFIEVLGTSFNINAYTDEDATSTTLIQGAVRIIQNSEKIILKPGEQAQLKPGKRITVSQNADVAKVLAWKNGLFNFNNASTTEVMRQLARWYDIEIVYPAEEIPEEYFVGKISRDLPLSDLLKGLETTKLNLRIEGRKLIVMP